MSNGAVLAVWLLAAAAILTDAYLHRTGGIRLIVAWLACVLGPAGFVVYLVLLRPWVTAPRRRRGADASESFRHTPTRIR